MISDKTLSVGEELVANIVDAAQEKHVPVVTISGIMPTGGSAGMCGYGIATEMAR